MKKTLLILTAATLAFASCKKDDDNNGGGNSGSAALTSGHWRITAISSQINYPAPIGTQTIDGMTLFQSCQLDNLYIFNTDGTATVDEGATKCDPNDPQQKSGGTWALSNNNAQLTATDPSSGTTVTSDVLTLNNSTLQIRYVTNYNNIQTTTTTTYTNQ